jgi:NlpC/P60 family protein
VIERRMHPIRSNPSCREGCETTNMLYETIAQNGSVFGLALLLAGGALTPGCSSILSRPQGIAGVAPVALAMDGTPYRYGGKSPEGFDCSGLAYYAYAKMGIDIPRHTRAQFALSTPITRSELHKGDLVFFRRNRGRALHVGIYLDNDRFIHAPTQGERVTIASLTDPYWTQHFIRGGRFP